MYAIKSMDFYVKISGAFSDLNDVPDKVRKVEYVTKENATKYDSTSDAAKDAEEMSIHGFNVVRL